MTIIVLHDSDAKIELIEVDASLIEESYEGDIEWFLSYKGYSINNITWMCCGDGGVPVTFHKFSVDEQGEEVHISREDTIEDLSVEKAYKKVKQREISELKAKVSQYGKLNSDGNKEYVFEDKPIIAGYLNDEPCDITINSVILEEEKYLTLVGNDKDGFLEKQNISTDDIFKGHLEFVTGGIINN